MTLKSFFVGEMKEGQRNDLEPFYLPEDAYVELEDAYVWRGRIRKRFGYSLIGSSDLNSRLRIELGSTDNSGDFSEKVPGIIFKIGQMFSIGEEIFTVNTLGTPGNMLFTGSSTSADFNTTTGDVTIEGSQTNTSVFFYPAEPVMGLRLSESSTINHENTIAFDTQFAYEKADLVWKRLGDAIWSGGDSNFFWSTNYRGEDSYKTFFYCSNFAPNDNIKYIETSLTTKIWTNLRPKLGTDRYLDTCRIIIPFKDRLVALNTIETVDVTKQNFPNRCRFSQSGDPTNENLSWLDSEKGRGGFINAPTKEQIVTAARIKDSIIVYFERSTWELVYTGSHSIPFKWQKINSDLGCESTFSSVVFDESVLGVGNVGIHGCNGVTVRRIDEKIPDEVFKIHNGNDGVERVYGIRDFYNEIVYWSFPDLSASPTYPTKVLLYNYRNNTWAFLNDSFTCFGYFQKNSDITWENINSIWRNENNAWRSPLFQSSFPDIIAGNQQGFVFLIDNERSSNSQSLYITDMDPNTREITCIDHNLKAGDFLVMEGANGVTDLNDKVFKIQSSDNSNTFVIDTDFSGTYTGGGKLSRVSNIKILTKSFNPGTPIGKKFRMPFVDFLMNKTSNGEVSVNYFLDTISGSSVQEENTSGSLLGSNVLLTRPEEESQVNQEKIWHRYYCQSQSQFLQLLLFMSDSQMKNLEISHSDFELHAMIFYVETRGDII